MLRLSDVLMDEAGDGAAGAAAGADGKGAVDAGKSGDAGPAGEGDAGKTVLGAGQGGENKDEYTLDEKTGRPSIIPEKYWDPEKKALRVDAKGVPIGLAKGYADLEKRLGSGELPPATPEDYKAEPVLAAVKEKLKIEPKLDPELTKTFAKEAHAAGLTQKQYEWVMTKYFEQIPALASRVFENSFAEAQKELQAVWASETEMQANVSRAYRAFMAYAPEKYRTQEAMDRVGNNPLVIQILAAIGKDMGEDTRLNVDQNLLAAESVENLMRGAPGKPDSPYWNEDDPQHKRVVAQVRAHHEAMERKKKLSAA